MRKISGHFANGLIIVVGFAIITFISDWHLNKLFREVQEQNDERQAVRARLDANYRYSWALMKSLGAHTELKEPQNLGDIRLNK